ncbi:hypothetical protein KDA00_04835, partial [Candidatus Saccharibacteria bacterium]|nr:hypothetical protein [Candidatus Saccharibacteria bacterium]
PATDLYPSCYQQTQKKSDEKKTIDVVSNKLATDCTPTRARKETTENASSFSSDPYVGGGNGANTSEKDDIHKCEDAKPSISIASTTSPCTSSCTIYVSTSQGTHSLTGGEQHGGGVINVIIDGQVVQSFPASQTTLSFSYSGTGTKSVQVELIDSVLYDASASKSIKFEASSGTPITIDPVSYIAPPSSVLLTWSGGTGPFSVSVDGSTYCPSVSSRQCSIQFSGAGPAHTITVTGASGSKSIDVNE